MNGTLYQKFVSYLCNNFLGNFIGFAIGSASTSLVAHFFTVRSIKNIWGLTASKTVVDKQTFHLFEWIVSVIAGFIVFELVSKWVKQKTKPFLTRYAITRWLLNPVDKKEKAH